MKKLINKIIYGIEQFSFKVHQWAWKKRCVITKKKRRR